MAHDLWKYCTKEQCRQFLLSLNLTGELCHTDEKRLALLYGLSNHAEEHYTLRKIPKRNGGSRTIYEPDFSLKYVQKQILRHVLEQFPVSDCACAYRKGIRLTENARPHVGKEKLLKLDIEDFFENITYISIYQHVFPGTLFPPPVRTLLTSLCCYDSILPQGAPTSPYISNLVMKPFDDSMESWCRPRSISYTRYCDDLTFSGSFDAGSLIRKVSAFLTRMGFQVNREKTKVCTRSSRQEVTGLTVNDQVQVPKEYRRQLRQEWYYIRKYGPEEHLSRRGLLPESAAPQSHAAGYLHRFAGKVAYVLQASPEDSEFLRIQKELREIFQNS